MKKSRYSEEQIIAVLRQAEGGQTIAAVSREHGIALDTFYRWRRKYGGMDVSDLNGDVLSEVPLCGG